MSKSDDIERIILGYIRVALYKFGYQLGNENGDSNLKTNFADFVFLLLYSAYSLFSSMGDDYISVLFVNLIVLVRLVIGCMIDTSCAMDISEPSSLDDNVYSIASDYAFFKMAKQILTISITVLSIIFTVLSICIDNTTMFDMGVFLCLGLVFVLETYNIIKRCYNVEPRITDVNNINTSDN